MTYDRLGTVLSSKPYAYTMLQTPVQAEVLQEAYNTASIRGTIPTSEERGGDLELDYGLSKIMHVGRSHGFIPANLFPTNFRICDAALLIWLIVNPKTASLRGRGFCLCSGTGPCTVP